MGKRVQACAFFLSHEADSNKSLMCESHVYTALSPQLQEFIAKLLSGNASSESKKILA
jgi:hypothetical protein